MRRVLIGSTFLLALAGPGAARAADEVVVAVAPNAYSPETVRIDEGQALTFANFDGTSGEGHTLIHAAPASKRRFESPVVPVGTAATVPGIDKLPAGTYDFACRIHAIMKGKLVIE